jgi:hypothetical protein
MARVGGPEAEVRVEPRVGRVVDQRRDGRVAEARQAAAQQLPPDPVVLIVGVDADVLEEGDRDPVRDDARRPDQRAPSHAETT